MARINRRRFLAGSAFCGLSLAGLPVRAWPQDEFEDEPSAAELVTDATQRAIDDGLEFLAARQHEDGAFGSGGYSSNVAVCSLAGLAFMSAGSTPGRGPYGRHVQRCVDFVMDNVDDNGFIQASGSSSHGPMYGHGFATLFLAECYGMTMRSDIRENLAKAVQLIIDAQNEDGGWRYQPQSRDADISVTVCQIMALRAARNAGLFVSNDTVERSIEYVKKSQNPDGGFMYMIQGGQSAFPRSAAGIVALYSAGVYQGDEIKRGLDYLKRQTPRGGFSRQSHYFYGHYYAVQAMWHARGRYWAEWYPAIRDELLGRQREDGSWIDAICPEYGTAMACIILQMPNNYLPILQR